MRRVLGVIFGILMCVGGVYFFMHPGVAFSSISIVFAITLIENAIGHFVIWFEVRKVKGDTGFILVNAILSLICGIALLSNVFTQLIWDSFILTFISIYMIAHGITTISNSFKLKKAISSGTWVLFLICGILVTIAGVFSIINPASLALSIGILIGIDVMIIGINLIVISLSSKSGFVSIR